jgi:site-specific recombinase XerD
MGNVNLFLRWLEDRGELPAGIPDKMFPNYHKHCIKPKLVELPDLAKQFLDVMRATSKPNTVNGYQSGLRGFYHLHSQTRRKPYDITRSDIEAFMQYNYKREINPENRGTRLLHMRRYLDWLFEHKKLKRSPDDLIKPTDFPKKEHPLPKPFSPEVDLEIQRRLEKSADIDALGVLLMRRCGLRVGELRDLTLDCVSEDLNGNHFLKVPLGKLNNERIIPLDPKTVEIVEKIKRHHSSRPEPGTKIAYLISNPSGRRRSRTHFADVLSETCRGISIPGKTNLHRLRHTFATTLLSGGLPIQCLKELLGHTDIKMTLVYAAVTQETLRRDYFQALTKVHARYESAAYPLRAPDLHQGVMRAFYDVIKSVKKYTEEHGNPNPEKLARLHYRFNTIRHEYSVLLKLDEKEKAEK